jgi:hypothetical protein
MDKGNKRRIKKSKWNAIGKKSNISVLISTSHNLGQNLSETQTSSGIGFGSNAPNTEVRGAKL